jgi:hypothetical protein
MKYLLTIATVGVTALALLVSTTMGSGKAIAVEAECVLSGDGVISTGDSFSVDAKVTQGAFTGNFRLVAPNGDIFEGSVTSMHCRRDGGGGPGAPNTFPNIADFEGFGTFNGAPGFEFAATAHDHGEGNLKQRLADDLAFQVADSTAVVYSEAGLVTEGNIQIIPTNPAHP